MITFSIDAMTKKKLEHAILGRHQELMNIVFHVQKHHVEVWFHFREKLPDGTYSAPSYEVCFVVKRVPDTTRSEPANPRCHEVSKDQPRAKTL